jgi:Tfp pilus assembly protein PilF
MALNAAAAPATDTISQALQIAIEAVNQGELGRGRKALAWVLKHDPNNAVAWLWMACCSPDDASRQECYRRVTSITDAH